MKKPKMMIFDYGHTLCYEPPFDPLKGYKALLGLAAMAALPTATALARQIC